MYDTEIETAVQSVMDQADRSMATLPLDAYCEALDDVICQLQAQRSAAEDDKRRRAQGIDD